MLKEFLSEDYENVTVLQHSKIKVLDRGFRDLVSEKILDSSYP